MCIIDRSYCSPIVILLWSIASTWKKPHPYELISVVLVVLGAFTCVTHFDLNTLAVPAKGAIWGLISAVCFAFYTVLNNAPCFKNLLRYIAHQHPVARFYRAKKPDRKAFFASLRLFLSRIFSLRYTRLRAFSLPPLPFSPA